MTRKPTKTVAMIGVIGKRTECSEIRMTDSDMQPNLGLPFARD